MTEHPSDPTTPLPDEQPLDLDRERRRRRKLKVIVATAITGTLVTGAASYAAVSSRGAAEEVAGVTPITDAPSYTPSNPSTGDSGGSGSTPQLPQQPGLGQQDPFGGSLAGSTDTTAATGEQQVGVVDIYTELADGSEAAGTGMVLTGDGEVLTNDHVIEDSTDIKVVIVSTGRTYDASVVGTDPGDDVAVLQLAHASGLDTVTTDTAHPVAAGDDVTGVGNAGGDGGDPSAASGTVVAVDQKITVRSESGSGKERLTGLIEVDADIVSGDSGGPLYDADTEVVGMNTAASSGPGNVTGYAIPIATALAIADDIEAGRTKGGIQLGYPGFLGVALERTTGAAEGATVAGVQTRSAAARAGISAGDTITSFDGVAVGSGKQLSRLVGAHAADDQVSVGWTDNGGTSHIATVTLGEGPAL